MANVTYNNNNNNIYDAALTNTKNNITNNSVDQQIQPPQQQQNNGRNLRDVYNSLQKPALNLKADEASYDHLLNMINQLNIEDDGNEMNRKIKVIEKDFFTVAAHNENIIQECMEYMNNKALIDGETSRKFAFFFATRNFQTNDDTSTLIRYTMMSIMEQNFLQAELNRTEDKNRLYNSINMLGEYYNRVRLINNTPVDILGKSLLSLLENEVNHTECIDVQLAKTILRQITLNGSLLRANHHAELKQLLSLIRRQLIEQPALESTSKALLIMTLEMYYGNFEFLGGKLKIMYTDYFIQGEKEAEAEAQAHLSNNNSLNESNLTTSTQSVNTNAEKTELKATDSEANDTSLSSYMEKSTHVPMAEKWCKQVCDEDSDLEFDSIDVSTSFTEKNRIKRRKDQPLYKPPFLRKQKQNSIKEPDDKEKRKTEGEVDDEENKPLPRWRSLRFKNNNNGENRNSAMSQKNHTNRRYSAHNFDEDEYSVRREGGSIRLYSIMDRLKHSQQKIQQQTSSDMNQSNYYNANSIANSNRDRQSLSRDDRSESSYISNYERGNHHYRCGTTRHYNNKQLFDKPPDFQKQQQEQTTSTNQQPQQQRGDKIYSETWRRRPSHDNIDEYHGNGPESHSRSSSRARTLPRTRKTPIESTVDGKPHIVTTAYRRRNSQSPNYANTQQHFHEKRHHNQSGGGVHRYSSQSSLASEASTNYNMKKYNKQSKDHKQNRQRHMN